MPEVTLPDGNKIKYEKGQTVHDIAKTIGPKLAKDALAANINNNPVDLNTQLNNNQEVKILTFDDKAGQQIFWHSTAHIMARAVSELFPGTKLAIGPAIENGFYYDFDIPTSLSPDDLEKIEERMLEIIKKDQPFVKKIITKEEATGIFKKFNENFKLEILDEIEDEKVSIYEQGHFIDLCRGPHLLSPLRIKAFKLLKIAGAYWKGDESKQMLQRIYGISFPNQKLLDEYLENLKEAERRDHRNLGRDLDIFHIDDEVGAGLPLWHPRGAFIREKIESYWKEEHRKEGYELVTIPHIAKVDLWKTSGHWGFYRENMYSPMDIDNQQYIIKPMNCPGHIKIYQFKTRSYRDLPIRWAEMGTVYRYERSGVLHGLLRVRGFTQDDAHIFCTKEQLNNEILDILKLAIKILKCFGFDDYEIYLSTRPEKYVGSDENWEKATKSLKLALEEMDLVYEVDPGEGVFYGPKIDIKIKDALGRAWQCTTIQVDFNLPERFNVNYTGKDNKEHQPIMIHRAILGSFERFIGSLIEHYAGEMPFWLAPEQVYILPIADRHVDFAISIAEQMKKHDLRAYVDDRKETTGKKIRDARAQKIPVMVILGDNELKSGKLAIRYRDGFEKKDVEVKELIDNIRILQNEKSLVLHRDN